MYRSYLAQKKYTVVLNEVSESRGKEFAAVKLLASFLTGDSSTKERIAAEAEKLASSTCDPEDYVHVLIAGQIAFLQNRYEDCLRILHGFTSHLEVVALSIQALLKLDRPDLARKEWKKMSENDEDAALTQLAQAWIILSVGSGGEKLDEAYYIYHDLSAKYGSSSMLLNGQAVALIARGKYQEAEGLLQESLEKDNNNAETLINLMTISHFLGKGTDVSNRYLNQLKDSHPKHPFVLDSIAKESELDYLIKSFSVTAS
jgi:coatomer protein complex subunit epsilon